MEINDAFINRVYKASIIVAVIGAFVWWISLGIVSAAGWICGALLSVAVLRAYEIAVKKLFRPDIKKNKNIMTKFFLAKLPIMLLVLSFFVWIAKHNYIFIISFIAGVALAQAVIVLKTIGIVIGNHISNEKGNN
ncbi:MAG: hypothetical protein SNJ70_06415 [Armatimonadota bacterium]